VRNRAQAIHPGNERMTSFDAAGSAAQARLFAPPGITRFVGRGKTFWRLLSCGAVLLMFTLGIYRFWLTTDVRRYLWSNTELAGESFEYTGTAYELLLGFLIALAFLVPLYAAFFLLTLAPGNIWSLLGLLILILLGHYAFYRARRYRLTRTIYRGVRFHQTGSAILYSVCAVLWWALIILSAGLAYPFAQSQLEHFKMRHTFFGNLPGRFESSGWHLLVRGLPLWAVTVVPFAIGAVATILAIDWSALNTASGADARTTWTEASGLADIDVIVALTGAWLLCAIALLYPVFHAIVLRWWVSGLRFGDVAVRSHLRIARVFGIYARFFGYATLFTAIAATLLGVGSFALSKIIGGPFSMRDEITVTVLSLGGYAAMALGYWTIYQATVKLGVWRCVIESLEVSNVAALEKVAAAGEPASPVGEGLADALNVGGI
jgi:uncharacterized membrane protein YjgN (DUF898 family)